MIIVFWFICDPVISDRLLFLYVLLLLPKVYATEKGFYGIIIFLDGYKN
jgi:hypothetical protein